MRVLVVFAHPGPGSYGAALRDRAMAALAAGGHEVRLRDLYAEGFDPVLSRVEWERYLDDPGANVAGVQGHVDDLRWAEALIVIYPTWYYGLPAMLKGWLERVWLPGVTFEAAVQKGRRAQGRLRNIRVMVGITTAGSPWWWIRLVRDPGRSLWTRGMRPIFHPRCRYRWLQLYDMNATTEAGRARFLDRVGAALGRL